MAFGSHVYHILFDYNQKKNLTGIEEDQQVLPTPIKEFQMSLTSAIQSSLKTTGKNTDFNFSELEAVRIQATVSFIIFI